MTGAEVYENLMVALDALRTRKVRSSLTVLGIVIGVSSVIAVAAVIDGLNGYIAAKIQSFGSRTYFVSRIPLGPRTSFDLPEKIRQRKYLNISDGEYLQRTAPSISFATVFGTHFPGSPLSPGSTQKNEISYEGEHVESIILRGVEPAYADAIPLFSVGLGRFITRYDMEHVRPVVVIGAAVADALFPNVDPIGKTVRLNGKLHEVVGVFEHDPGLFGGPGVDQFAVIPLSEFHKHYPESKELIVAFSIPREVPVDKGIDEVVSAMRRLRKVPPDAENDFEITSPDFLSALWNQLTGALVLLTGVISSIGLLVGGIGVMNIMLISVTERTTEIGVRKAIGARSADIRVQFLLEAVILSLTGGVLGILCGAGLAWLVRTAMPSIPATVSLLWVALGVGLSAVVGLFFGYYPASRAASLDPIVCLRYE